MKEEKVKNKHLDVRLSEDDYNKIHRNFKKTTCRKLSDYARKILLDQPVVGNYRNESLDDFMAELIRLRKDLNAVGNNFNQAVKKLHTMDYASQVQQWAVAYELDKRSVQKSIEAIEFFIAKIGDQWLQ